MIFVFFCFEITSRNTKKMLLDSSQNPEILKQNTRQFFWGGQKAGKRCVLLFLGCRYRPNSNHHEARDAKTIPQSAGLASSFGQKMEIRHEANVKIDGKIWAANKNGQLRFILAQLFGIFLLLSENCQFGCSNLSIFGTNNSSHMTGRMPALLCFTVLRISMF